MINAVPETEGTVPLMGVRMNDNASTVLVGLFYTKDKKWSFKLDNVDAEVEDDDDFKWTINKTYQVVVKMNTNEWYVHVDGMKIYNGECGGTLFNSHRISHFYFGGDSAAEGRTTSHDVTVTNVLLYNKLLVCEEIEEPNAGKFTFPQPAAEEPVVEPHVFQPLSDAVQGPKDAHIGDQAYDGGVVYEGDADARDNPPATAVPPPPPSGAAQQQVAAAQLAIRALLTRRKVCGLSMAGRCRVVRTEKLQRSKQTITQQVPLYQALAPQQAELQTPVGSKCLAPEQRPLHLKRRWPQAAALLQTMTPGRLSRRTQATFLRLAQLSCLMET
ncbi:trans-sialidase, partial [Trypanosoma rangeli]